MRKFIVAASLGFVVIGFASGSRAEPEQPTKATTMVRQSPYDPHADFDRFTRDLTLTKEQQASIKPILADLEKELLPLRKLTYQRLGQRGGPIVQKYYGQLKEQLKPEQLEIFDDFTSKGVITPFVR